MHRSGPSCLSENARPTLLAQENTPGIDTFLNATIARDRPVDIHNETKAEFGWYLQEYLRKAYLLSAGKNRSLYAKRLCDDDRGTVAGHGKVPSQPFGLDIV